MNFLSLGMKSLKAAKKEKNRIDRLISEFGDKYNGETPEEAFHRTLEQEKKDVMDAFEIGMSYWQMVKPRLEEIKDTGCRHYFITWRPPHDINFNTFKFDVEKFIKSWENKWIWWEYAYEQKGTDEATMGNGFHCHLIVATTAENYYPSHILRNSVRCFPYIAKNCIQVDIVRNLKRTKEYIRGDKKDAEKEPSIAMDRPWREKIGLQNIYSGGAGQVQPAPSTTEIEYI